ncbi:carbohydrate ABC transporter permease [Paenibacillus macerans]|uniref:carbohydrate ABC transporter permease n=1 Tax=Paenibacillus macerans TaxID=44252 RepID=UPI002E233C3E|nr:carbohydrate ABC transporter permease [Paenibacillus macerans]
MSKPSTPKRGFRPGTVIRYAIIYALLAALALFMMGPFLWLLSVSLMPGKNVFSVPPAIFPSFIDFANYAGVWKFMDFPKYMMNTVVITALGIAANVVLSSMTAYPLAAFRFKGRNLVFGLLISTMIIPSSTAMIVHYLTIQAFRLGDTYVGVVLPAAVSVFNIFLMRQTFMSVPADMRDSGKMDGASEFRIFWQLMLPLVKPGLAVIALLEMMAFWNNFLWPIVILNDPSKYPLAAALTYLNGQFAYNFGWIAAGTMISVFPIIAVFLLTQRYFIEGMSGALKG